MERVDELTLKLLDQTIADDELSELAELTQMADRRKSMHQLIELEAHLQSIGRSSIAVQVVAQVQQERCDRVEAGVMQAVAGSVPASAVDEPTNPSRWDAWSGPLLAVGVAALAACLLFVIFAGDPNGDLDEVLAQLDPHGSIVTIVDADGNPRIVQTTESPLTLHANETVETTQAIDTAEIVYADGTKIELLGETRVRLTQRQDRSKELIILSGLVQADVSPQPPGKPLRIVTQTATLEVLGTTLGVEVRNASTRLGVATGRVAMTRKADGQRVEVQAGRFATATQSAQEPLQSHPFPELSAEWSEDFEAGAPAGWRTGELVKLDDSTAVRAIQSPRSGGRFVITSHNAWQEGAHGLCKIDANSVLHMRIRQSEFARITLMIGTRAYPPETGRIGGNLFYTKKAWNEDLPPDTWRTISVPLSDLGWQMKQGKKVAGPAPLESLAAYLIHVSTMKQDAGLMIDRIWISNDAGEEGR